MAVADRRVRWAFAVALPVLIIVYPLLSTFSRGVAFASTSLLAIPAVMIGRRRVDRSLTQRDGLRCVGRPAESVLSSVRLRQAAGDQLSENSFERVSDDRDPKRASELLWSHDVNT